MGMQIAQAAQPISQQQPSQPQGKGSSSHPLHGTAYEQIDPQLQQTAYGDVLGPNGIFGKVPGATNQTPQPILRTQQIQPQGKNGMSPNIAQGQQQFQGKGSTTNAATSGQPQMGQPNNYPNTIQPWDNANIQPRTQSGKGKGY